MTDRKVSLRVTVGGMFLLATILTALVAVSLQYYFSKKMATEHTLSKLTMASEELSDYMGSIDSDAANTIRLLSSVNRSISNQLTKTEVRTILVEAIKDNPLFYSIYIGSSNDNFFQIINLESSPRVRDKIQATLEDRWVVIDIQNRPEGRIRSTEFYDANFNLRDRTTESTNYLPTTRPWYISANKKVVEKTQPYLFQHLQITGQTYSLAFLSKNNQSSQHVIGIDIVLSSLSNKMSAGALGLEADSEVESYLYSKSGHIIATNQVSKIKDVIQDTVRIDLTSDQKKEIAETGAVLVSNQNDWGPMDFSVSGKPQGYAIDLLSIIEDMSGINFEFVNGFSWGELVNQFKEGELDALHSIQKYSSNGVEGLYTDPIFDLPFSVVTHSNSVSISKYADLEGKKVAVLSGWSIIKQLKEDFPSIELVEFSSLEKALDSVEKGECDAVLDVGPVLAFALERYFHTDLKVSENLKDLTGPYSTKFYIALRPEHYALIPIINRAIHNISAEQMTVLENKWFKPGIANKNTMVPYSELHSMAETATVTGKMIQIELDGKIKHLYLKAIPRDDSHSEYFAVVIPEKEIYATVTKRVTTSIGVTVFLMCLTLPVAWVFGAPIVRPIKHLRMETGKIKKRDYDNVELVDTRIKEIWELSTAIQDMSAELKQHEQTQEEFVEAFIKLIAQAIDDKSPYTAGHCNRVPELGMMLAEAAEKSNFGSFKDFNFTNDEERREFRIAAWLHDCGKITTPEHIVDKGTKLEANYNRIHEVRTRFEVLWRDAEIKALKDLLEGTASKEQIESDLKLAHQQLTQDYEFIATSNVGGEFMSDDKVDKIKEIAETTWLRHFDDNLGLSPIEEMSRGESKLELPVEEKLLSDKPEHIIHRTRQVDLDPSFNIKMEMPEHQYNQGEVYNLSIARGTLTAEDRFKINEHMISTIKMLENLPFPKELSRVPRYASTHHETLKGTGYPRKLTAEDLSIPERVLVIADIFEALTASDRPYKKAKPISVAVDIMHKMALDEHMDIELFRLFLTSGTHVKYAQIYLKPEQNDHVDIEKYLA